VTFVSLMVHVYTIGYMHEDPGYNRFFSYISLFTFSMLMLVMSNNFLQLFFGWEAVGLVSYLLIGFWYTRPTAVYANLKAFLVNRVGDFGFLLGIGLVLMYFGTLDYAKVFEQAPTLAANSIEIVPGHAWSLLTVTCILLFVGAMGKSAQFPLHVWLPDSMEGPTPISALIHAATMVTAGIFMVSRMSPLFELSQTALSFVLVIGAINHVKGFEVLAGMAQVTGQLRLPLTLGLLGYSSDDARLAALGVQLQGRYFDHELSEKIDGFAPDLILIPSIGPETYCYVLTAALASGRRVAVFDLGAQADRTRATAPLTLAPGAVYIDTTTLGIAEVVEQVMALVRARQ